MSTFKAVEYNNETYWYDHERLKNFGDSEMAYDAQIENGELKKDWWMHTKDEPSFAHIIKDIIYRNGTVIGKFSDLVHKDV